jgi:hypothetical protein
MPEAPAVHFTLGYAPERAKGVPSAAAIKSVGGTVYVGLVSHAEIRIRCKDTWGDERFPWRVLVSDGDRTNPEWLEVESYASFRHALAVARRLARWPGGVRQEYGDLFPEEAREALA